MHQFIKEKAFWCNEKPLSLALLNFAKRKGFYPILGIDGFLKYSRRELLEAGARLPHNLIQGKGEADIVFFNDSILAVGTAATTTYALIKYKKFPSKAFDLYTRVIFANPENIISAYRELVDIGLRIPTPVVGKAYKTLLLVKSNVRLRRLVLEGRKIVLLSIIPFYAPRNVINSLPHYLNSLLEYAAKQHDINVSDFNVFLMYPDSLEDEPPDKVYFKCITRLKECLLEERIIVEKITEVIGDLRGCRGCRYVNICRDIFVKFLNVQSEDR